MPPLAFWLVGLAESLARAARECVAASLAVDAEKALLLAPVGLDGGPTDEARTEGTGICVETLAGLLSGVGAPFADDCF